MNRKHYIAALYSHFTGSFLVALAEKSPSVLSELEHCQCKICVTNAAISVEFQLGNLFNALWRHAIASGDVLLPTDSDWDKDFKEFCRQLMNPWPIAQFEAAGFQMKLLHKSNKNARHLYEITLI